MKRLVAIILLCLVLLCACTRGGAQPFSADMGRQVWRQQQVTAVETASQPTVLPAGYTFVRYWGRYGFLMSAPVQDSDVLLYGVWTRDGWVLPCHYVSIIHDGAFYMGAYYRDEALLYEVYNAQGDFVVGTRSDATLYALSDRYFVLYSRGKAQVFDTRGTPYFIDGLFTTAHTFALCGDYLLSYCATDYSCAVWQLLGSAEEGAVGIRLHAFAQQGARYTAVYTGHRFLVTALTAGDADDYTYMDASTGTSQYLRQSAWWYDPDSGDLRPTSLDWVLLASRGLYTPGIAADDRALSTLNEGYTAVNVAVLDAQNQLQTTRYYVMDADARLVMTYPVDPTALRYCEGYGYTTATLVPAALYGIDGNLLWRDDSHAYAAMRWQNGRLVAAYGDETGTYYGAFDAAGNVVVPFDYDYVAPFVDGVTVVQRAQSFYRLDEQGEHLLTDLAGEAMWMGYGVYVYAQNGRYGLKKLDGTIVCEARWQSVGHVGMADGVLYIIVQQGQDALFMELT